MVWLDPTARFAVGEGGEAWLSINDEAYFALQQYQPHLDAQGLWKPSERFRIVLKASSGIIVAVDDTLEGIFEHWEWIETNLLAQVSMFEDEQETLQFVILKLTSMAKLQMNEPSLATTLPMMSPRSPRVPMRMRTSPTKLSKESTGDNSEMLEETFGITHEHIVEQYEGVSVWMKTQHKGTMYITSGHLCFQSSRVDDYALVIPLLQMATVNYEEKCRLLGGEVSITTAEGSECVVSGLENRKELYHILTELRRIALIEHLIGVEKAMIELNMEFENVCTTSKPLSNPTRPADASSLAPRTGCPFLLEKIEKEHLLVSQASLQYHETFRLPRTERLWAPSCKCLLSVRGSPVDRPGTMYCSERFLCFYGSEGTILAIPTSAVRRMEGHMSESKGKFVVYMEGETNFTFSAIKKESVLKEVLNLWETRWRVTCASNDVPVLTLGDLEAGDIKGVWSKGKGVGRSKRSKRHSDRLSVQIRQTKEKQHFFDEIIGDLAQEEAEEWQLLQSSHHDVLLLTPELIHLVRSSGLPKLQRGSLWYLYSGARAKQMASPMEYRQLLQESEGKQTIATDEIERDLCRTFPEHPFFQKEEGIDALRRVLTAYAFRNPTIGYCQSMNIVSALMIMFMPEEHAFWTMTAVCEDLVPDYYSPSMARSATDQQVLEHLLEEHMPQLRAHLDQLNIPVALVSIPWFLCLFIGALTWDTTVRILDCFFVEGRHIFFQCALAVFKCSEAAVLGLQDTSEVIEVLKDTSVTCEELLAVAFGEFSFVDREFVEGLESTFCRQVLKDLEVKVEKRRQAAALQLTKPSRLLSMANSCGRLARPHASTAPDLRISKSSPTVPAIDINGDGDAFHSPASTRARPSGPRGTSGVNVGRHRNASLLSSVLSRKSSSDGYSNLESVRKGRAERKKERDGVLLAREYRSSRDMPIRLSQRFCVGDIEAMLEGSKSDKE